MVVAVGNAPAPRRAILRIVTVSGAVCLMGLNEPTGQPTGDPLGRQPEPEETNDQISLAEPVTANRVPVTGTTCT